MVHSTTVTLLIQEFSQTLTQPIFLSKYIPQTQALNLFICLNTTNQLAATYGALNYSYLVNSGIFSNTYRVLFCLPSIQPRKGKRTSALLSLPEEIQVDIFLKLPLKSIGISRCVCKVWCSLLRNPKFIKIHLRHTTNNISKSKLMLIFYENKTKAFCSIDYASILSISSALPASAATCSCHGTIIRDYPFKDMVDKFRILGSCDGLIFIDTSGIRSGVHQYDNLCIWNPSTGEYKHAPLPHCNFFEPQLHFTKYGFCYDWHVDSYKLIKISKNANSGHYQVEVYTVGSELWKTILSNYKFGGLKTISYKILNGAIHCLGYKTIEGISSKVIISFDMSSEKFVDFIFPEEANPLSNDNAILHDYLQVMNDCLYIVTYSPSVPNRIDVWQMKDYGVRESWTKLFTLTTNMITDITYLKLQWSFASGEVLIKNYRSAFLYDPVKDRIKVFKIHDFDFSVISSMNYQESLVSPNSGT